MSPLISISLKILIKSYRAFQMRLFSISAWLYIKIEITKLSLIKLISNKHKIFEWT